MATPSPWWNAAPVKGVASLAVALAVTFLPFAVDTIRARARATPIAVVASPGSVDTLGGQACDSASTDSATACPPANRK